MIGVALCISTSQPIRRPSGLLKRLSRRFPSMRFYDFCSETATAFMVRISVTVSSTWLRPPGYEPDFPIMMNVTNR